MKIRGIVVKKKEIGHLLVIRLSAMGDVAMAVPVIAALRNAYPEMKISVLTRRGFHAFFRGVPGIDFVGFDPTGRHKGFGGLVRLAGELRARGIDAVADLHDVLRTKVLRMLLLPWGVHFSVIDKGRAEKKEITRRTDKKLVQLPAMTERYRQTFESLGLHFELPAKALRKEFPVPETISKAAGEKNGVWVGIAPFAKHKGKIYPIPQTDELIGILASRYERVFVFGGGDYEKSFAEGMERLHDRVVSAIGKMSMSEEMDLMSNLDVMVSMDSATMHISSLLGVPVVSVWGATHPYAGFYGYGQDPANAVQSDMACRPCSVFGDKPCIFGDYRCMLAIKPQNVADRVAAVVAGGNDIDKNNRCERKGKS